MKERIDLPASDESERAILASLLLDPGLLPRVTQRLEPADFYSHRHQHIFVALRDLGGNGGVNLRTLQAKLEQRGQLDEVGGLIYLAGLDVDLPDLAAWESYVAVVEERALRRRVAALAERLRRDVVTGDDDVPETLGKAAVELRQLIERSAPNGAVKLGSAITQVIEGLEDSPQGVIGLSTGYLDVDRLLHGLRRGTLTLVAGRPGMGKTSWAMNVAANLAIRSGAPVGVASLEMSTDELAMRVLCAEAEISSSRLIGGYLTQAQWAQVIATAHRLADVPLWIDDRGSALLHQLEAIARRWRSEEGIQLLIVDYLQLMRAAGRWPNREQEVSSISRSLKLLARELDIPILALSQLNRQSERRGSDHRPQLSDLRESGSLEQDADAVLFVHREEVYSPDDPSKKGLAEIIVAKNRSGPTGDVELVWLAETTSFKELWRGGPQ